MHPGDLQNAFVPTKVVAVFYFGVATVNIQIKLRRFSALAER